MTTSSNTTAATLEPWANDPAAETEEVLVERAAFAAPRLRSIQYDRKAKGYAMSLDGEFVGYADTYHDAEVELDRQVFGDLTH